MLSLEFAALFRVHHLSHAHVARYIHAGPSGLAGGIHAPSLTSLSFWCFRLGVSKIFAGRPPATPAIPLTP